MVRGTTPTFVLTISDNTIDLTEALNVYVTFKQNSTVINKKGEDIVVTAHQVDVYLSQKETLKFVEGSLEIQLNWTYMDGRRACSVIKTIDVEKNLIGSELK